jgi:hypothetical protein
VTTATTIAPVSGGPAHRGTRLQRHPVRGTPLVTATVTFDPAMQRMGRAALTRIEDGRGTPGDHDVVAEAYAELVSHLASEPSERG